MKASNLTHTEKLNSKKPKILLIINGGCGQVYSSHTADVMVIDHDNLKEGQDPDILDLWEKSERLTFKEMLKTIAEAKAEYVEDASIVAGAGS
jgi:hypothetical protein